ncbi:MAG: hypothetical protein SVM86_07565 [Candidatus Cloacimonadota bacterium]|nr:hypothetical protein [Candidatus Cloacimonadota bacterium]
MRKILTMISLFIVFIHLPAQLYSMAFCVPIWEACLNKTIDIRCKKILLI